MKKNYFIVTAFILVGMFSHAQQDFEWQWAKRGGGWDGLTPNNTSYYYDEEKVMGIAIDQTNNYYFVAEVGKTETDFDGTDFTNYNTEGNYSDLYIVSTDCQGSFRWQKSIGGAYTDRSRSIATDAQGGVYVSGWAFSTEDGPLHFDTDSITGVRTYDTAQPGNKNLFLIKYDTEGNFEWLRQPQKDDILFSEAIPYSQSCEMVVEPNGTVHWLMRMETGTHVNGNVTIPAAMEEGQFMVLKYDHNGNYIEHIPIPMEGDFGQYATQFHYDRLNDQYYVASFKRGSSSPEMYTSGALLEGSMMIAAFNGQGQELWRHDNIRNYGGEIFDITSDGNSDIFFTGKSFNATDGGGNDGDSIAGYTFTQTTVSTDAGDNGAFLIKLEANGNLLWGTNADITCRYAAKTIAINGDEVAIGLGLGGQSWQGMAATRPQNHLDDPVVVRFDKATGNIISLEDIEGTSGYDDEVTALAVDNNGNYVVGGFIKNALFLNHPNVPMITNSGGPSDFFVAQLAHMDCTQTASVWEQDFSNLKVHPNPTQGTLYIEGNTHWASYRIYSMLGQVVAQGQLGQQEIFMEDLNNGVYFLELQDNNGKREVVKVVRE